MASLSSDDSSTATNDRQAARKILDVAADAKSISRSDLKKAIWLYAGKQSTEKERLVVGGKILDFLNKKQVKLV